MRASLFVLLWLGLLGCDGGSPARDAGASDAGTSDAGTAPDCDADPLLPGCTDPRPAFTGPSAAIEILRDADGVPHIYAQTDADAYYASGYMQAFDRLLQMELTRRRARGTRAELLGPGYVDDDRVARLVDIPRWGRTNEANLFRQDREHWLLLQAWTSGVNARIAEVQSGAAPMPPELAELGATLEPWEPADGFIVGKLIVFGNGNQLEYDILTTALAQYAPGLDERLHLIAPVRDSFVMPDDARPLPVPGPSLPPREPAAHLPRLDWPADMAEAQSRFRRFTGAIQSYRSGGSNNWVIDGRHTASGRPLLAGDPHQPLQSPSLFWMHHMNSAQAGGSLDVIGFSFVGTPSVQLGHNRSIAWGATTTYADGMDLWEVRVSGGMVRVADQSVPVRTRTETIAVAGGAPVELVVEEVPGYGVLLPEDFLPIPIGGGGRILFNWTGLRVTHEGEGFHDFNTATSIADFEAAADRMELGLFNFVAADADGISYRSSPLVPDRGVPRGIRPFLLLDGGDPATYWTRGFLPLEQLPHSRGGARGWIASANNDPWGFTADGTIEGDPWYFGIYFDPGLRSARIESEIARLVARGGLTVEDMQALQDDTYSVVAEDLVPALEEVWASRDADPALADYRARDDLDALVGALGAWDYRMERAASEPVVFNAFAFFLARRVLEDDLVLFFEPILSASGAYILKFLMNVVTGRAPAPDSFYRSTEPRSLAIVRALDDTASYLVTRFGGTEPSRYTWGAIHGTRFDSIYGDRLDGGWIPTDGAEGTVNVSDSSFFDGEGRPRARLDSTSGSLYRLVASFRDDGAPEAFVNVPRGVSGDPASPHWDDLQSDWQENRYRRLRFTRAEVEADPTERLVLAP
ncbi:MAG: penicillin acylase family protein [Sandaracinaceae bacterium]|nr:penicillin acylase family protein [Sandaracinaceae bacterium]